MFFVRDDFYCNLTHENAMPGCCTKQGAAASLFMKILHKRQKNLLLELLMYQICAILLDVSP